jgi:hypothetical protein
LKEAISSQRSAFSFSDLRGVSDLMKAWRRERQASRPLMAER